MIELRIFDQLSLWLFESAVPNFSKTRHVFTNKFQKIWSVLCQWVNVFGGSVLVFDVNFSMENAERGEWFLIKPWRLLSRFLMRNDYLSLPNFFKTRHIYWQINFKVRGCGRLFFLKFCNRFFKNWTKTINNRPGCSTQIHSIASIKLPYCIVEFSALAENGTGELIPPLPPSSLQVF